MQVWRPKDDQDSDADNIAWLPLQLRVSLDTSASPSILSIQELAGSNSQAPGSYELTALVCNVHDPKSPEPEKPHYVAYIRRSKMHSDDKARKKWYLFNDVAITSVPEREVVAFDGDWKVPSILIYTLTTTSNSTVPLPVLPEIRPITKVRCCESVTACS
jgi:hypothetical protein